MVCAKEPDAPEQSTDSTVAQFIIDLRGSGQDCRSRLQSVKEFFEPQQ
jgi:hypothetical protein